MSIELKNNVIYVNGNYTVEQIAGEMGMPFFTGYMCMIDKALVIETGSVSCTDYTLIFTARKWVVKPGAGTTFVRSKVTMGNLKRSYGFGGKVSGNLTIQNSVVDAWCFWGFFSGGNKVILENSTIKGFGRIAGADSVLRNIIFTAGNGKYGIISTKGAIKEYNNPVVNKVYQMNGYKCATYFNPSMVNEMRIEGGVFDGYDNLVYVEDKPGGEWCVFVNSDIRKGYGIDGPGDVNLLHVVSVRGNIIGGSAKVVVFTHKEEVIPVVIKDGHYELEIPVYRKLKGETAQCFLCEWEIAVDGNVLCNVTIRQNKEMDLIVGNEGDINEWIVDTNKKINAMYKNWDFENARINQ